MPTKQYTEGNRTGEYLLSEGNGGISRETVTITGGTYTAGQVLGKVSASGKYTAHDPAATNGSQHASAVLYNDVDASTADTEGVVTARLAEVTGAVLIWKGGIADAEKVTAISKLAEKHIIVR